jgi:hypothetical protein
VSAGADTKPVKTRALGDGRDLEVGELLKRGGEASVYGLRRPPGYVLKEYHPHVLRERGVEVDAKLRAMVERPPHDPTLESKGHVSIAWPVALALDERSATCGFIMRAIDRDHSVELHRVRNPSDRLRLTRAARDEVPVWLSGFTWKYVVQVAINLASAVAAVHERGYVIGDHHAGNVLVNERTLITIIDCDSFQVPARDGGTFFCRVRMRDECPHELLECDLNATIREHSADDYLLALHVYQLLMEGRSPYGGRWVGEGRELTEAEKAKQGAFHYSDARIQPPAGTPPFDLLSSGLRELCVRAFRDGAGDPANRPSAHEWQQELASMRETLTECAIYKHRHTYPGRLGACPWCGLERAKAAAQQERKRQHGEAAARTAPRGGGLPATPARTPESPTPPKREPPATVVKGTAGSPPKTKPATRARAQPRPATWAGRLWFLPAVVPLIGPPVSWTYAAAKARSAIYLGWAVCYWIVIGVGVIGGVLVSSKAQRESRQLGTQEILLVTVWLVSIAHTFAQAHGVRTAIATREAAKAAALP